jgi:phosphopantetheinyl transferase (holo-ACP synthase)
MLIKNHNVETGELIEREMNAEELAQYQKDQAEAETLAKKQAETKAVKLAAQAKLAALGLTADDLKALGL